MEHYRTLSAVFPILIRSAHHNRQVLLARRSNTGYMDGLWDFAGSGHVDEGETAIQAVVREAREELGIRISENDVTFAHLSHRLGRNGNRTYYDIYFIIHQFRGEPTIKEPDKCSQLTWFPIDALPDDMIVIRRQALKAYLQSECYSEIMVV